MHDCERFREDLTEQILEGTKPAGLSECDECELFYREALAAVGILDSSEIPPPELSDEYWLDFNNRLRVKLQPQPQSQKRPGGNLRQWIAVAATVAVVVGLSMFWFRTGEALIDSPAAPTVQFEDDHVRGVDPGTIEFLGQSELFLRSFVKIEPTDFQEIEDARTRAQRQLAGLNQRKDAVVDFAPVQNVLDDYETILRDIGNLDQESQADITDVQGRIERNGLIASMKVYQPRLVLTTTQE